jgi:hypothetical protein
MANTPLLTAIPSKQFSTSKVEDLPPVEPLRNTLLTIRLNKMRPDSSLRSRHLSIPILASPCIMLAINPPLLLDLQIPLEIQQQISRRHRTAREEVLRHPARLEIVGRALVREQVHEEFAAGLQQGGDFGEEQLVVLHVLEELDAEDAVVGAFLRGLGEGVRGDVACDDLEVGEVVFAGLGVDVLLLGARVGEGGDLAVGEDFGEVETEGAPAASVGLEVSVRRSKMRAILSFFLAITYPRSKIFMPSLSPALSTYISNMAISAWARVSPPLGYRQHEYFIRGPRDSDKTPVPTS